MYHHHMVRLNRSRGQRKDICCLCYLLGYDIIRIVTIQVITQFLFVINSNGTDVKFFNTTFLKTVIFLCLAILIYWLIIRKLIVINFFNTDKEES